MSRIPALQTFAQAAPVTATATPSQAAPISNPVPAASEPVISGEATPKEAPLESSRFANLAKKEAKIVSDREALKKEQEKLAADRADLAKKMTPFQEFEVLRSKDPVAALQSLGFSETDIVNWFASKEKKEPTPEERAAAAAKAEIENFKKEQAEKEAKASAERDNQITTRFKGNIKKAITDNAEKFEYCNYYGAQAEAQAYNYIKQVLTDTGEMLSIDTALTEIESYYEQEDKAMVGKVKKRQPPQVEAAKEAQPAPKTKTLTNATTATVAGTAKITTTETRAEKRARLEEALRNGGFRK